MCISHFEHCTAEAKDPLSAADDFFRGSLVQQSRSHFPYPRRRRAKGSGKGCFFVIPMEPLRKLVRAPKRHFCRRKSGKWERFRASLCFPTNQLIWALGTECRVSKTFYILQNEKE